MTVTDTRTTIPRALRGPFRPGVGLRLDRGGGQPAISAGYLAGRRAWSIRQTYEVLAGDQVDTVLDDGPTTSASKASKALSCSR